MNKWKKIFIIGTIVLTTIIIFCIYTMTNQAYNLVNASINVSKRQAEIDSTQKEIENLKNEYADLNEKMNSLKKADSLGLNVDSINQTIVNKTK